MDGDIANFAIVIARMAETGDESLSLVLVDLTADGCRCEMVSTVDPARSHAEITFDGAAGGFKVRPGKAGRLRRRFSIGRPFIWRSSRSAVQRPPSIWRLTIRRTDLPSGEPSARRRLSITGQHLVDLELARENAYHGTWAETDDAPDLPVAAAATRVSSPESFNHAARENIQTYGGMGFTWAFDRRLILPACETIVAGAWRRMALDRCLITMLEQRNAA